MPENATYEIQQGERFKFGENWNNFLTSLSEEKIQNALVALRDTLGNSFLAGKSFLDLGSGSGLHSLAARKMGATVHSIDYDEKSVQCTVSLRDRFFAEDDLWKVQQGSALDEGYIRSLGTFDVVYSWGVLHHTGNMWEALRIADFAVKPGGMLFISIYNDQGRGSKYWAFVKKTYNKYLLAKAFWTLYYVPVIYAKGFIKDILLLKNPLTRHKQYKEQRGMNIYHDIIDWIGGYPFEVAKPEELFNFYKQKGYTLEQMKTCGGGHGCNELIFKKTSLSDLR